MNLLGNDCSAVYKQYILKCILFCHNIYMQQAASKFFNSVVFRGNSSGVAQFTGC